MLKHLTPPNQQEGCGFQMVTFYDKVSGATRQHQLPAVAKLEGIFRSLNDGDLLNTLRGKVHRGCQGYDVKALWHSYLAAYALNIPTVASLIRALESNPALCTACGLSPNAIPSEPTYSRFVAKLASHSSMVEAVIKECVQTLRDHLPDFGDTIAVDSSDLTAYSQSRKPSDVDARWAKKRNKHGRDHWWFGFKVHMVADARHELPLHVEVTPANVSDSQSLVPVLRRANLNPKYILADAGYDSIENHRYVHDELKAIPIIKLNRRGKKNPIRTPHRTKEELRMLSIREYPGIHRESPEWRVLYAKRVAIERLFGRMKEFRRLGSVHHRGLSKITLHVYLSTLTVVASAVSALYSQQSVRKVA